MAPQVHTDTALEKLMISISESGSESDLESEEFSLSESHTSEVSKERNEATPRGKERTKWVVKEQSDEDCDGSVGVYMVGKIID